MEAEYKVHQAYHVGFRAPPTNILAGAFVNGVMLTDDHVQLLAIPPSLNLFSHFPTWNGRFGKASLSKPLAS